MTARQPQPEPQSTRAVTRALALIVAVCDRGRLSLTEAAALTELSPSTALRLLRTLQAEDFVIRDDGGCYQPGFRAIRIGVQAISSRSVISLSSDSMESLVEETGESIYLSVTGPEQTVMYVASRNGTHAVRHTGSWVGRVVSAEGSASGQALANVINEKGFAVVISGVDRDATAIAAPISAFGSVVAALSLVVPNYRASPESINRFGSMLVQASKNVSSQLLAVALDDDSGVTLDGAVGSIETSRG